MENWTEINEIEVEAIVKNIDVNKNSNIKSKMARSWLNRLLVTPWWQLDNYMFSPESDLVLPEPVYTALRAPLHLVISYYPSQIDT